MKFGIENEAAAKNQYIKLLINKGHQPFIHKVGFVLSEQIPFIGGSPDGLVTYNCQCCLNKRHLLEVSKENRKCFL